MFFWLKTTRNKKLSQFCCESPLVVFYQLGLCGFSSINNYLTSIIEFAFMPMCSVIQMRFSGYWIFGNLGHSGLVMRSSFVSSGLRSFSLRMCHFFLLFVC